MVNPTTSPLIFSKLLYNIYLPLPIFLPPTNKNYLVIFLNPSPLELRSFGLSPIFPYGNTGEKVEYFLSYRQNHIIKECLKTPPLPCPVTLQGVTYKIGAEAKGKYISSSAVPRSITGCFAQQNIGEVSKGRRG